MDDSTNKRASLRRRKPFQLFPFLKKLDQAKICYSLSRCREETIMVQIAVPGERWEVEFFSNGSIEVEIFKSNGTIAGHELLTTLFKTHSDSR